VACFFQDVIERVCQTSGVKELYRLKAEHGSQPIYELEYLGERLAIFHPGVGAPLAAGWLEEVIAMGVSKVIACGGAGSLEPELTLGHVIVPASAVRDEGTSYHYLPPGRDIEFDADVVMCLEDVLRKNKVPYVVGKTWTTDAIYRETRARAARRRNEGCIAVEMEAASLLAVAKFRGVQLWLPALCWRLSGRRKVGQPGLAATFRARATVLARRGGSGASLERCRAGSSRDSASGRGIDAARTFRGRPRTLSGSGSGFRRRLRFLKKPTISG